MVNVVEVALKRMVVLVSMAEALEADVAIIAVVVVGVVV